MFAVQLLIEFLLCRFDFEPRKRAFLCRNQGRKMTNTRHQFLTWGKVSHEQCFGDPTCKMKHLVLWNQWKRLLIGFQFSSSWVNSVIFFPMIIFLIFYNLDCSMQQNGAFMLFSESRAGFGCFCTLSGTASSSYSKPWNARNQFRWLSFYFDAIQRKLMIT